MSHTPKHYKGKYTITNLKKYDGNARDVVYRSSWELQVMRWCDHNSSIVRWSSEEVIIPYRSPLDNRVHRYFVDFKIVIKDKEGNEVTHLVEVKPKKQTKPPKKSTKGGGLPTKRYVNEVQTYAVNQAKWSAATEACENKGWKFMIITEDHLKTIK